MCVGSIQSSSTNCQSTYYCNGSAVPCLPHWKFSSDLSSVQGTGPAVDGDEDATLGMILLVLATKSAKSSYSWWNEVAQWAWDTCRQYADYNFDNTVSGQLMLKLGACWGGWSDNNPSYHGPGHWRAFRDYMAQIASTIGMSAATASSYGAKFNMAVSTSYEMLSNAQCSATSKFPGTTPNWYMPGNPPSNPGSLGSSGSGTPSGEYGSEACRGPWRIAVDYLWYSDEDTGSFGPTAYSNTMAKALMGQYNGGSTLTLNANNNGNDPNCVVTDVMSSFATSAFMYAPTFTSLTVPVSGASNQQTLLDQAATQVANTAISDYYDGSWVAISTPTLNGDLASLKALVRASGGTSSTSNNNNNNINNTKHNAASGWGPQWAVLVPLLAFL